MAEPALSFAVLLRRFRAEARLTQEELAEAAGLSPRSVSDLERGVNRTARKDTAVLLADALSLTGQVRVLFVAAARGRAVGGGCCGLLVIWCLLRVTARFGQLCRGAGAASC